MKDYLKNIVKLISVHNRAMQKGDKGNNETKRGKTGNGKEIEEAEKASPGLERTYSECHDLGN